MAQYKQALYTQEDRIELQDYTTSHPISPDIQGRDLLGTLVSPE